MELLSVLAMLFQGIVLAYDEHQNSNIKNDSKEKAIKNGYLTYIDNHGKEYDVRTDRRVTFSIDHGDKVYRDSKTWKIVRNISAEERASKKANNRQKAIEEGKRFFYDPEKKLYCEITTGEYYKRFDDIRMDFTTRYMNINNNKTVYEFGEGPTDEEIEMRAELYKTYCEANKAYNDCVVNPLDYDDGINDKEYANKNLEKCQLHTKRVEAEHAIWEHDRKMKAKYLNGGV